MISRRRFLGSSGVGILALSAAGCRFPIPRAAYGQEQVGDGPLGAKESLRKLKDRLLGYPINMNSPPDTFFAWRRELAKSGIDEFSFNNVGNPFKPSPIPYNTHDFERRTILAFGKLFGFPANNTWGFLSNSGTDSNMHGMYMGRTILKARSGVVPRAYFTREAHYSVQILADLLGLEVVDVDTLPDGGMDPDDLARKVSKNKHQPALVVATVGTTFKGAIDGVDAARQALAGHTSYLHLDAALFGGYLPFTNHAAEVAHRSQDGRSARYESIAVSCHKFFGFPSPAGLFMTTRRLFDEFSEHFSRIHNPEYIHQVPGTITCSRDAVKPAEFYFFTRPPAIAQQKRDAEQMLVNADYLLKTLQSDFPKLAAVRSNDLSNTVYFRHPGDDIVKKYSLATMSMSVAGKRTRFAHVVVMPHVSRNVLGEFLSDLEL